MEDKKDKVATDLAWAAGIFDGEGYIAIGKLELERRAKYSMTIGVSNTSTEMLVELRRILGGRIKFKGRRNNWKPLWCWEVYGTQHSAEVLCLLSPYLRNKRRKSDLAILFAQIPRMTNANRTKISQVRRAFFNEIRA